MKANISGPIYETSVLKTKPLAHRMIPGLNENLPPLGFGTLRFSMEGDGAIARIHELLDRAMALGVNYFDAGWTYLNGRAEQILHDAIVTRYPRDDFYIATKLPLWLCHNRDDMEYFFDEQLKRVGVESFDFYLAHAMTEDHWTSVYPMGLLEMLEEKRRLGLARHIGFSFHGTPETLEKIITAYSWEFVLLQINYFDWNFIRARQCYEIVEKRGIPCMIMEPLRGGTLCRLPEELVIPFRKIQPEWTLADWGLRFAASLPNAAVILSGMNELGQLTENVNAVSRRNPLSVAEQEAFEQVEKLVASRMEVPCTGCGYCIEACPQHIAISNIMQIYNGIKLRGIPRYLQHREPFHLYLYHADACISCGACIKRCPQNIQVPEVIKKAKELANDSVDLPFLGISPLEFRTAAEDADCIVCFGTGKDGKLAAEYLRDHCKVSEIVFTCNSSSRWGTDFEGYPVIAPEQIKDYVLGKAALIVITTRDYRHEISNQIDKLGLLKYLPPSMRGEKMTFPDRPKVDYAHNRVYVCDYSEIENLISFCEQFSKVYLYGGGERSQYLAQFLLLSGIQVEGYVTSKPSDSPLPFCPLPRFVLDELELNDAGIILALSQDFYPDIIGQLYKKNFYNFFMISEHMRNSVMYTLRPRKQHLAHVTVNIVDHCNLRCKYCDHYSQLVDEPKYMSIGTFKRDMLRLKQLCPELGGLTLEGGEPLLHPNLTDFMQVARNIFGFHYTTIGIVTNGIRLLAMDDTFFDIARANDIKILVTKYPSDVCYEAIEKRMKEKGLSYSFYLDPYSQKNGKKYMIKFPLDVSGRQPKYNWMGCQQFHDALALMDGRLYNCTQRVNVQYFNQKFGENLELSDDDSIDIFKAESWEEIAEFLRKPISFCRYCNVKNRGKPEEWSRSKQEMSEFV